MGLPLLPFTNHKSPFTIENRGPQEDSEEKLEFDTRKLAVAIHPILLDFLVGIRHIVLTYE